MQQKGRSWLVWILILGLLFFVFQMTSGKTTAPAKTTAIPISEMVTLVESGAMKEIVITGNDVVGKNEKGEVFVSVTTDATILRQAAHEKKTKLTETVVNKEGSIWVSLAVSFLPIVLLVLLGWFLLRGAAGAMSGQGQKMKAIASAKATITEGSPVKFTDVAGIDEAVAEVRSLVEYLRDPGRYARLGGRAPKGILLKGPSGTGKTLLARAIAGEAGVPFLSASASGFVEMFVGVGAARVRDLFEQAKKNAPCIVFIDEIDALGKKRQGASFGGGTDEREQTLNELLVAMDGFTANDGVIILAATNRPDTLDSALTRAGRFDRQVTVPKPDIRGRKAILLVHARKIKLANDVDLEVVAQGTPGLTGADLEQILNDAALHAAENRKQFVGSDDISQALDKLIMGGPAQKKVLSPNIKRVIAAHEAGHAVVAHFTPTSDPLYKITIIPHGPALGLTVNLPTDDRYLHTTEELEDKIALCMGGRAAEQTCFQRVTTGASGDLASATSIAKAMVCEYAMGGEGLGQRTYGNRNRGEFLDYGDGASDYGDESARAVDQAIRAITDRGYKRALDIITEHREAFDRLVQALLTKETVESGDIADILGPRSS